MSRYYTDSKSEIIGGFIPGPNTSYVIDRETDEIVGEVSYWDHEDIGEKIASGDWEPYEFDHDESENGGEGGIE